MDTRDNLCHFAVDLYDKVVRKQAHLNSVFFSPLSIYTTMAMMMAGSDGNTKQQLLKALRLSELEISGEPHEYIHSILKKYFETPTGVELSLANRLFVLRQAHIQVEYSQVLQRSYRADTELLTSIPDIEAKRQHMNNWVAMNTRDKIKDLILPGVLSASTLLSLINAIYFKGKWQSAFLKDFTYEGEFYCLDGEKVKVEMMCVEADFPYFSWDSCDAHAIRLPFRDSDWQMLIVLPNEEDGLNKLVDHLRKPGNLEKLLKADFVEQNITVHLPKFKLSEGVLLYAKELLIQCGIHDVFDSAKANLSKICADERLFVSDVLHKSVLEIDEEGATAAAATALMAVGASCYEEPPPFMVDHPFFIALVCDTTVPVFVGHVTKPENP